MQIIHPSLSLYFVSTGTTKTTTSLVQNSINITKQLYNDLHSSSNSCSLQLRADNTTIIEDIIKDDSDIKATLTDGNTTLFTGILSNEHAWRVSTTGEDVFQLKIEDIGTRYLNKPLVDDDDTCIRDTLQNVIGSIATRCSISTVTFDSTVTTAIKEKILVNKVSSSTTCKDALDTICYEFGLVYYFNESGNLVIKKTGDLDGSPSTTIATTGDYAHYLYESDKVGVDLTRKSRQYSQARVQYSTISDSTNIVPIYAVTENITVPAGEWWDGATHVDNIYEYTLDEFFVANKTYYTFNGTTYVEATVTVGDPIPDNTYYEYAGQASMIDMVDSTNGKDILYVYPDSIVPNLENQTSPYPGYVERVAEPLDVSKWTLKQHKNTTKLDILIDNTLGGLSTIYSLFQAKGRIIRKQGTSNIYRSVVGLTANSEVQFNYESQWIHDKNDAIALCEMLSNYYLYCDNTYTFYCKDDLDLGSVVRVYENLFSGLDVNMLLTAKQYTGYRNTEGLYKYTAQGITAFNLGANTRVENYEIPTGTVTLVSTSTSYALDDQGTDPEAVTGWQSTIPTGSAGDFLWTRTEFVYSSGQIVYEYSVSFIAGQAFEFRLKVTQSNLIANRRRTDTQEINISTIIEGYAGTPTIRYWWSDENEEDAMTFTAASVTAFLPYDHNHPSLIVTAELSGAPTQTIILDVIDETETFKSFSNKSIDTSAYYDNGVFVPENYSQVDWSTITAELGADEQFVQGDNFFNNYVNSSYEDYRIYVYDHGVWVPVMESSLSNTDRGFILSKQQKNVLSIITPGTVTKSDYGYFNTIIAGTVDAGYIGGKEIEVHDGGFVYAGDVDINQPVGQRVGSSGAGFCFDSNGNAEMSNIRITGDSTIEGGSTVLGTLANYDNNDRPIFKTVKEANTGASMSGSKVDGTSAPSAYSKDEWKTYIEARFADLAADTTYTTSGNGIILYNSSSAAYQSFRTAKRVTSVSSAVIESVTTTPYDQGQARNLVIWPKTQADASVNSFCGVTLSSVKVVALQTTSGWPSYNQDRGDTQVIVYKSNGSVYRSYSVQDDADTNLSNVFVPRGGYVRAYWGTSTRYSYRQYDGSATCKWYESDIFNQGVGNYLADTTTDGSVWYLDEVLNNAGFKEVVTTEYWTLNFVAVSISSSSASSWPITKYYRFSYTQSPGTTTPITTSAFSSKSFSYKGISKTAVSITFSNSMLKVTDSTGQVYEFSTATGYYYPQHSFNFVTLSDALGAYMRVVLPTDDDPAVTYQDHNIGGSGTYASGNSQRWNTGFFKTLDATTVDGGWSTQIVTANYTITDDIPVGVMRPYFLSSSSNIDLTMPGDSSQRYVVLALNVLVGALVTAGKVPHYIAVNGGASTTISWLSSTEPYMLVYVLRIS